MIQRVSAAGRKGEVRSVGWTEDEIRTFLRSLKRLYRRRDVLRERIGQLTAAADTVKSVGTLEAVVQRSGTSDPTHLMVARWVDELPGKQAELAHIEVQLGQFENALATLSQREQQIVKLRYIHDKEPYAVCVELGLSASREGDLHRSALRALAEMMD